MCGIYGAYRARGGLNPVDLVLSRDKLLHRGPDDGGYWISGNRRLGLAQRRLSVIDLSSLGHQPMLSSDGRFAIVFNGEIFNYQQLKESLSAEGVLFLGNSDTEVLLAAYITWGEAFLSRLNGMFALAIYD